MPVFMLSPCCFHYNCYLLGLNSDGSILLSAQDCFGPLSSFKQISNCSFYFFKNAYWNVRELAATYITPLIDMVDLVYMFCYATSSFTTPCMPLQSFTLGWKKRLFPNQGGLVFFKGIQVTVLH